MQIHQIINAALTPREPSLHGMVAEIINDAAPLAVHNRNYVVNNIPADLQVQANDTIIASVFDKLFQTALRNTQNSVMLISAKVYGHVVLLQLKSKGNISPALSEEIGHASIKAQKTGGVIEVTNHETEQASIAYCFLNVSGEA